ncbi:DNA repair protein RecN [Rhodothalassium salexigens]|uniref:DNA repair protein RecN n=1 Tax=Rhodothalassium salexigens TaxID=1086 RepID=UPI0019122FD8|nr:DNA repair protein RecN [Rhodothalassium salexigens]MBK5911715.1 DNA repair protein RecN [Rhodothalassium salexigens]MBK5919696.1 DNA repair protein RecN [Rhodothalassium salexigens]
MLVGLSIHDIVLIDRLTLGFDRGLSVLTGETGAGKSILLDALSLALGARADSALVRRGASRGVVAAEFDLAADHAAFALLADTVAVEPGEPLVLRRTVQADGRSRAHINDQPVSAGLLRQVGERLVEIHGQHDERGLLNPKGHRALLDLFAGHGDLLDRVATAHRDRRAAADAVAAIEAELAAARADEDYLRHALDELEALAPEPGEEAQLALTRTTLMQGERLAGDLADYAAELEADGGVDATVRGLLRRMERLDEAARARLDPVMTALDRAAIEMGEAMAALDSLRHDLDHDPAGLERAEERLFELRAMARKHQVQPDDLAALKDRFAERLAAVDRGDADLTAARAALADADQALDRAVGDLRRSRAAAADALAQAVNAELPDLKLDKARFRVALTPLDPAHWSAEGGDGVAFEVATNPGADFGPLIKIASGGELARFILALKVSLARQSTVATLVFDEVDRGIGGATADAVGERLARLATAAQVLVVTHSPQVAARGRQHWRIAKRAEADSTATTVEALDDRARREEIARMLSGAEVTDAARQAADSLMTR